MPQNLSQATIAITSYNDGKHTVRSWPVESLFEAS